MNLASLILAAGSSRADSRWIILASSDLVGALLTDGGGDSPFPSSFLRGGGEVEDFLSVTL